MSWFEKALQNAVKRIDTALDINEDPTSLLGASSGAADAKAPSGAAGVDVWQHDDVAGNREALARPRAQPQAADATALRVSAKPDERTSARRSKRVVGRSRKVSRAMLDLMISDVGKQSRADDTDDNDGFFKDFGADSAQSAATQQVATEKSSLVVLALCIHFAVGISMLLH